MTIWLDSLLNVYCLACHVHLQILCLSIAIVAHSTLGMETRWSAAIHFVVHFALAHCPGWVHCTHPLCLLVDPFLITLVVATASSIQHQVLLLIKYQLILESHNKSEALWTYMAHDLLFQGRSIYESQLIIQVSGYQD